MGIYYYKVKQTDKDGKAMICVLATEKEYGEVMDDYEACEEIFPVEAATLESSGMKMIEDFAYPHPGHLEEHR